MKLIIKKLQGEECSIEIGNQATILDIKKQVFIKLKVPPSCQRLLLLGKTLLDENPISEYKTIKDGTKINLVIKNPDTLEEALQKYFRKYYSQSQSQKYANEVNKRILAQISCMSLDDIERLAKYYLHEEENDACETPMVP